MNLATLTPAPSRDGSCVMEVSVPPVPICAPKNLIADDNARLRQLIASVPPGDGFEVSATTAGEETWEALHHEGIDLLITDNDMPRHNGVKLIERIRNEGASLPVIMASGSFSVEKIHNEAQLHIGAVFTKPFDTVEFLETVKHTLKSAGEAATGRHEVFHAFHASPQPVHPHN